MLTSPDPVEDFTFPLPMSAPFEQSDKPKSSEAKAPIVKVKAKIKAL